MMSTTHRKKRTSVCTRTNENRRRGEDDTMEFSVDAQSANVVVVVVESPSSSSALFCPVVIVDQTTQKIRDEEKKRTQQTLATISTYGSIARRAFA